MNDNQKDYVILREKICLLDKSFDECDNIQAIRNYVVLGEITEAIEKSLEKMTEEEFKEVQKLSEEELNFIKKERSKWKISNLFKNFQKL